MPRLLVVAALALSASWLAAIGSAAQTPPTPDPIDLFAKMYRTFTHPRCINCHGVVKNYPGNIRSVTATHHNDPQGDPKVDADCGGCHDTPKILETAWQFGCPRTAVVAERLAGRNQSRGYRTTDSAHGADGVESQGALI